MDLNDLYTVCKENSISGRYFPPDYLEPILEKYRRVCTIQIEGQSEELRNIYSIRIGTGFYKVLLWSQMHGNETTTTKALIDFLQFLNITSERQQHYLKKYTFLILPILNPDGALRYTRFNANQVDLNRDAFLKSQREMQVLHAVFQDFQPDLCLNMHDQRSIFSAGDTANPAALSFLSPAADPDKSLTPSRIRAMQLVVGMYDQMPKSLKKNIGRFDDTFNQNCIGDTFQSMGVPSILIEAGHMGGDYQRENTREYVFWSLIYLFDIAAEFPSQVDYRAYFSLPENRKNLCDVLIINARIPQYKDQVSIALQVNEQLISGQVIFQPTVVEIAEKISLFGHKIVDAKGSWILSPEFETVKIGLELNKICILGKKYVIF